MSRSALLALLALLGGCESLDEQTEEGAAVEDSEIDDMSRTKDEGGLNGDFNYCKGATPCDAGEGDCDIDAHCSGALVCGTNNGGQFGLQWSRDVCVEASCTNGTQDAGESGIDIGGVCGELCGGANGDNEGYCSASCPCAEGEGDCDSDSECLTGLSCRFNQGAVFGAPLDPTDDVCMGNLGISALVAGDLAVTEIMNNPSAVTDAFGEYFEITNNRSVPVDIQGLIVRKTAGNPQFVVGVSKIIQPHGFLVFSRNGNTALNGGIVEDFDYPNTFFLNNTTDSIVLDNGPIDIDRVVYNGTWPQASGSAMELDVFSYTANNNDPTNWCSSNTQVPSGDDGSPGDDNRDCP